MSWAQRLALAPRTPVLGAQSRNPARWDKLPGWVFAPASTPPHRRNLRVACWRERDTRRTVSSLSSTAITILAPQSDAAQARTWVEPAILINRPSQRRSRKQATRKFNSTVTHFLYFVNKGQSVSDVPTLAGRQLKRLPAAGGTVRSAVGAVHRGRPGGGTHTATAQHKAHGTPRSELRAPLH